MLLQYMAGEMKVDEFITHNLPLAEINAAFHVMHEVRQCAPRCRCGGYVPLSLTCDHWRVCAGQGHPPRH